LTGDIRWTQPDEAHSDHSPDTKEEAALDQTRSSVNTMSSSSDGEGVVLASDGAVAILRIRERRSARAWKRKRHATLAARQAVAFLEEAASNYHERVRNEKSSGQTEDDMPAFVDAQSLRDLAAGTDGWTYKSRKERKAAKLRAEASRIASATGKQILRNNSSRLAEQSMEQKEATELDCFALLGVTLSSGPPLNEFRILLEETVITSASTEPIGVLRCTFLPMKRRQTARTFSLRSLLQCGTDLK